MKTKTNASISFRTVLALLAVLALSLAAGMITRTAFASVPGGPLTVVVVGSFQSEVGCPGDWQPGCAASALHYDAVDGVWQGSFSNIPPGSYEYKVALNKSWDENYGQNAQQNGANISLTIPEAGTVKFYYDATSHWVTSDRNPAIANVPGSFQHWLGCSQDWQPDCLVSWLRNPDGDQIYDFTTERLRAGSYEAKVALNESWNENYGMGGVQNGANIPFTINNDCDATRFEYNSTTHVLNIQAAPTVSQPSSVTIVGSLQSELGCSGDWQPDCATTNLTDDAQDGVWQGAWTIPAGNWEYKVVLDGSWTENYGHNATFNGANISLNVSMPTTIKFYYSQATHWVTDNYTKPIFTAPGSFQSELGCSGDNPDWAPDCLRSWLQDPDGDGIYSFSTTKLPPGNYEVKVAVNESWDENYGAGGVQNGSNISFSVPEHCIPTSFHLNAQTHVLTVRPTDITAHPGFSIETQVNGLDADTSSGAVVQAGSTLTWKYEVINSGALPLTGVSVTDDQGLAVTCPKTSLQAGEFMSCTASATTALPGQHVHVGTVSGNPPTGAAVTSSDPAYYYGSGAFVSIESMINGYEAESDFFAHIGDPLQFTYVVTDSGDTALTDIVVTDDKGLTVTCPKTALDPAEAMICTAQENALTGYITHIGSVSANPPSGPAVTASDPATYQGGVQSWFSVSLETLFDGSEADTAPGISSRAGSTLVVSYQVTNTGIIDLVNIAVSDDQALTITCPHITLGSGESMTCTAQATALAGQHAHVGSVSAGLLVPSTLVTASDSAYYYGYQPSIAIETLVNDNEADTSPGFIATVDSSLAFAYLVTNPGDIGLANIAVTDNQGINVICPKSALQASESMTCTATTTALAGQYVHVGSVSGDPPEGSSITASDPAYYYTETVTFLSTGFTAPVDLNNVLNVAKAGQTIPLKWRLLDASGNPVTDVDLATVNFTVSNYACGSGTTTDIIEVYAAGASGMQNLGDGYYQYNWQTPKSYANSCKMLTLKISDWTTTGLTALFQFKK